MPVAIKSPPSSSPAGWFTYILRCSDSTYYTGVTTDLKRRVHEHNSTARGAKYTRCRRPVTLVYYEQTDTRQNACRREYAIKQLRAAQKATLIDLPSDALRTELL